MSDMLEDEIVWIRSDHGKSQTFMDRRRKIQNLKWGWAMVIGVAFAVSKAVAEAQQPKVHHTGVLLPGETWYEIIDGLRVGLAISGNTQ